MPCEGPMRQHLSVYCCCQVFTPVCDADSVIAARQSLNLSVAGGMPCRG